MSAVMRARDWASTPLGSPETWPEGLKVPLRMMLTSRFEMWLGWGPEITFFYNDAYIPTLGNKHPDALGQPMREVWREVFATVEDRIHSVMHDGVATWDEGLMLLWNGAAIVRRPTTLLLQPSQGGRPGDRRSHVRRHRGHRTGPQRATPRDPARPGDGADRREHARGCGGRRAEGASHQCARLSLSLVRFLDGDEASGASPLDRVAWPFDRIADGAVARISLEGLVDPPKGAWISPPARR